MAVQRHRAGDPGHDLADLGRLALERVAQQQGRDAGGFGDGGRRLERPLRCRDHHVLDPGQPRIAGLGRLLARLQVAADRLRRLDAVALQHRPGVGEGVGSATVGPDAIAAGSSPGTSEISRLTTLAGCAAAASLPPLIAERCLADRVHLGDVGAAGEQRLVHRLLVRERQPWAGSASRDEPPPEIRHRTRSSGPAPSGECQDLPPRPARRRPGPGAPPRRSRSAHRARRGRSG